MPTLKPDMADDPSLPPRNNNNNNNNNNNEEVVVPPVQPRTSYAPVVPHGQPAARQTREDLVREWINRRIQLSSSIPGASTANSFSVPGSSYSYDGVGGINTAVMNLQTANAQYIQSLNTVQQLAASSVSQNQYDILRQSLPQAPQGNLTSAPTTAYETTPAPVAQTQQAAPVQPPGILPSELSGNSLLQEALKKKIAQKLQEKLKKMRPDMSDNDRAAALALLEGNNAGSHSLNLVPKQQQDPPLELQTKYSQEGKLDPPQIELQTKSAVPQQNHTTLVQSEDHKLPQRMQVDKQSNDTAPPVKKKSLPISREEFMPRMQKINDVKDNAGSHSLNLVPKQQQDPPQLELQTKYSQEGKLDPPQIELQTKSAVPQQNHTTLVQSEDHKLPQRMQVDKQNNDTAPPNKKKSPPVKINDEKKVRNIAKMKQGQNENATVKATKKAVSGDNSKRVNDAKIIEAQPAAKKRKTKSTPQTPQQIARDLDTVVTNELSDNIRSIIQEDRAGLNIIRREKLQSYEEQLAAMQSRLDMYTNLEGLAEQIAAVRSGNTTKKRSLVDGAVDMIHLSLNNYQMLEDNSDRLLGIDDKKR